MSNTQVKPNKAGQGAMIGGMAVVITDWLVGLGLPADAAPYVLTAISAVIAASMNYAKHKWFS